MKTLVLITLIAITIACPSNCNDCDSITTFCYACAEKFQLSVLGTCVDSNTIANCNLYGPTNQCFACQATFTISNTGQCIKDNLACLAYDPSDDTKCISCGFGTVLKNSKCTGAINCNSNISATCSACNPNFTLKGGNCIDNTGNCKTVGTNGVCTKCNTGFNLIGYTCISSNITVYGCYIYDSLSNCQVCKAGYDIYQGNCLLPLQIQQIQQGITQLSTILSQRATVTYTTTTTTTVTTTSPASGSNFGPGSGGDFGDGFGFNSGNLISNCAYDDGAGNCLECQPQYYLISNQCNQVSVFCNTYDNQNGNCLTCKYGLALSNFKCIDVNCLSLSAAGCSLCRPLFSLNSNNYCQLSDPNCLQGTNFVCNQCAVGYFVGPPGSCQALPPNCATVNSAKMTCTTCVAGFQLNQGACTPITKTIITTTTTTSTTSSNTITIPFCAVQSGSICNKCIQGYQLSNNQCTIIITLPANCLVADINQSNFCLNCISGFTLNNGVCVQAQSSTTPFCQSYNLLTGQCIACMNGYVLNNMICAPLSAISNTNSSSGPSNSGGMSSSTSGGSITIGGSGVRDPNCAKYTGSTCSSCSNRYYFGSNGICIPVNPLCNSYNSVGACLTCYSGYIINGINCIVTRQSDPYCKTFSLSGACIQCYTGYFYNQGLAVCQPLNPLCKTSNTADGTCTSCYPGYSLNGGICGVAFQDPNCQKYDQAKSICTQCAIKFYLDGSGKCRQVNPLCKTANSTTGACLTCYPGYVISSMTCVVGGASNTDVNCQSFNDKICQKCYKGYFVNSLGRCSPYNPLCKTSDSNTGICLTCYPGYVLSNGNCTISTSSVSNGDPNCKSTNQSGVCTACYSGYFLSLGMICQKMDPLCKTYISTFTACASCFDGYTLQSGQCILTISATSLNNDPYCIKLQGVNCVACAAGCYLPATGVCTLLNSLCKNSNLTTGACIDCYPGYQISGTTCIVAAVVQIPYCYQIVGNVCTACIQGYYVSNGICMLANILCATYNQTSGDCIDCIPGLVKQSGSCILPSLGVDINCAKYSNSYCAQCSNGYVLVNYWCNPIDPNCTQYDPITNNCLACLQGKMSQGSNCV